MTNNADYVATLEEAKTLSKEQIKEPYIPAGIYAQESEDLYHWCLPDKNKFTTAGVSEALIESIPVLTGAFREAQSIWNKNRQTKEDAEKEWSVESPQAFDFRDQLVHTFRFAFRKDDVLLGRVDEIADGDGNADMIQDLNDLNVLGRENTELLTGIGFDLGLLDKAAETSDKMADLLARANGERNSEDSSKVMRDRMYTLLKTTVDEIKECGKYLFWRDPEKLKGYRSGYIRKHNSRRDKEDDFSE